MSPARQLIPLLLIALTAVSCDKRGPVRREMETAANDLKANQELLLNLQNESKNLSASLGKNSMAGQGLIDQLTKEAAQLQADIELLKSEKEKAEQQNTATRSETQSYLTKHARL